MQARACNHWTWTTTCTCCGDISPGDAYSLSSCLIFFPFSVFFMHFFSFFFGISLCIVLLSQAVLRALYAYFADRPLKEIPHIEVVDWKTLLFHLLLAYLIFYISCIPAHSESQKNISWKVTSAKSLVVTHGYFGLKRIAQIPWELRVGSFLVNIWSSLVYIFWSYFLTASFFYFRCHFIL